MFKVNLAPVFRARGITRPYTWLVKAGMSRHTASKFLYTDPRDVRLAHLAFLCKILVCDLRDILVWTPAAGENIAANHPLRRHNRVATKADWQQTMASMPLDQLHELTEALLKKVENKEG